MTRRDLPRSRSGAERGIALGLALLVAGAAALAPGTASSAAAAPRPGRILLISIDGLGDERVDAARMPALVALLERGARCESARSPSGRTFPALTALLSGRSPASTGVSTEGAVGFPPAGAALAPALGALGYRGLALPADPFAHSGSGIGRGFARFVAESPALSDSARVDTALAWLARPGRHFVWLGLSFGEAETAWRREDGPAFADARAREARARDLDEAIARLAVGLERAGLASGTLLAVAGTHALPGDADPRRVPIAFIRLDGPGGDPIPGDAGLVDVAPSLVRAAGGKPAGFDGRALLGAPGAAPAGSAETPAESPSPCRGELRSVIGDGKAAPDSAALERLRGLAERCPEDRRVAIEEADGLSRARREADAARRFLAVRERWPEDPASALAYAQHLVRHQRFEMVGAALAAIPRTSPFAAEAAWLEVIALAGELRFTAASAAARRAAALAVPRGSFAEAPATFDRLHAAQSVAESQPDDFAAQMAFGRQLGEFGLTEEAYRHLHRARLADSTSAEPDFWIATFLLRQGRLKPAAQTFERGLVTDPGHRASRVALAEVLIRLDRWREAIPQLERAVAEDPGDARSGYNLACLLARDGRSEEALRALRRALDAGYDDWDRLAEDADLAPLRDRPEFRALLARRPEGR